ncbi:MAG: NUDIX domain-containing protein [Thermodesulfovibrionales bacterium]|nr:NUDIX domain-containing protein [Thermodesulfovibrionales bacterium]
MEILEIVDDKGNVLGTAPRDEMHGNPALMHKVVHVLVFNSIGELTLQKRSLQKDVCARKWDTSVGGHMAPGEGIEQAAHREMLEELGIDVPLEFLYKYVFSSDFETEMVFTFRCTYDGKLRHSREEIDEVRPWGLDEIRDNLDSGLFCNNFIHEFNYYMEHISD